MAMKLNELMTILGRKSGRLQVTRFNITAVEEAVVKGMATVEEVEYPRLGRPYTMKIVHAVRPAPRGD